MWVTWFFFFVLALIHSGPHLGSSTAHIFMLLCWTSKPVWSTSGTQNVGRVLLTRCLIIDTYLVRELIKRCDPQSGIHLGALRPMIHAVYRTNERKMCGPLVGHTWKQCRSFTLKLRHRVMLETNIFMFLFLWESENINESRHGFRCGPHKQLSGPHLVTRILYMYL